MKKDQAQIQWELMQRLDTDDLIKINKYLDSVILIEHYKQKAIIENNEDENYYELL